MPSLLQTKATQSSDAARSRTRRALRPIAPAMLASAEASCAGERVTRVGNGELPFERGTNPSLYRTCYDPILSKFSARDDERLALLGDKMPAIVREDRWRREVDETFDHYFDEPPPGEFNMTLQQYNDEGREVRHQQAVYASQCVTTVESCLGGLPSSRRHAS